MCQGSGDYGPIQCECNCDHMGGISSPGWVVISLFAGLVIGSVLGTIATFWFIKHVEREKRQVGTPSHPLCTQSLFDVHFQRVVAVGCCS